MILAHHAMWLVCCNLLDHHNRILLSVLTTFLFFYSDEEVPDDDPDYEDSGDLGGSVGGQSPTRKRAREGSPDNQSSTTARASRGKDSVGGTHKVRGGASRGRARASGGRGKAGRGRGRAICRDSTNSGTSGSETEAGQDPEKETPNIGFDFPDNVNVIPAFNPHRPPGIHFEGPVLRNSLTTELDFFRLFLTPQMVSTVATHTNTYALSKVGTRGYNRGYTNREGVWHETSDSEIDSFIALLIYFGLVKVGGDTSKYWSTKTIYHGLWARKILSRDRYKALAAFLHVVDPADETPGYKLQKVEEFIASFKERCKLLYQPSQKLAVDERMVKSKHRSGMRQFMKDKPTKWGLKLWVLADSDNGYTVDFNVYTGKNAAKDISQHGLSYDVVMELMDPYLGQGYHLYLDNFYTSPQLVKDLFSKGTPSVGTVKPNRKDFPKSLLNVKAWAKKRDRGSVRWVRHSPVLALQWIDSKPVSILTTLHSANDKVSCKRRTKKHEKFQEITIPQPVAIHDYNQFMNGVDRSDQMLACHNVSKKCYTWWKTLFFHLVDIAVVNSFILFQRYREEHADVEGLQRARGYSVVDFRGALVRQICGWPEYDDPPAYEQAVPGFSQFQTVHMPRASDDGTRRNCVVCKREGRGKKRVITYCAAPQCQKQGAYI